MHKIKKIIFLSIYKMFKIRAKTWKNGGVEVINDNDVNSINLWLSEKHIETETVHSNLPVITN